MIREKLAWLDSFELWSIAAVSVVLLDAWITFIGTHKYGISAEGNPLVRVAATQGMFYMPFAVLGLLFFIYFGCRYLWDSKLRAARYAVRLIGWTWVGVHLYFGPLSWLSFVYL